MIGRERLSSIPHSVDTDVVSYKDSNDDANIFNNYFAKQSQKKQFG